MERTKKLIAVLIAFVLIPSVMSVSTYLSTAAGTGDGKKIIIHYYQNSGVPTIYYWNTLPKDKEVKYPGAKMSCDGNCWYSYTFENITKVNMIFVTNNARSKELTRARCGEFWYKNDKWTTYNPDGAIPATEISERDMRDETIYFVITTRFYNGNKDNCVHCWDDAKAGNTDEDPAWRGDFKGLIKKLDYIKALGFSAIWITPVVTNCGGYDYHGYHAMDFSTIDARYESEGATYQDLIDEVHKRGMKLIQDVVWNHTSNFGERWLCPMFTKEYNSLKDLEKPSCMKVIRGSKLDEYYPNYNSLTGAAQYQARIDIMHGIRHKELNDRETYHRGEEKEKVESWNTYHEQQDSIEGDCRDINTENPAVADYLTSAYSRLIDMGVDCFRLDTEKHINRWTLNSAFFPQFEEYKNFYIFGEVCSLNKCFINWGGPSNSPFFYTWKEKNIDNGVQWADNWSRSEWKKNYDNAIKHFNFFQNGNNFFKNYEVSNNALLNGNEYHEKDMSQSNGTGVIDFTMHYNFNTARQAFNTALGEDKYFSDSTWNVVYVDSHDYGPSNYWNKRYDGSECDWAENLDLMFTFRGIPCLYYGSEIQFQRGKSADPGLGCSLSCSGRAYFGDCIEGEVYGVNDFGEYSGVEPGKKIGETLDHPLARHIRRLNKIRREIPALRKGQYSTENISRYNDGIAFKRAYKDPKTQKKSFVCVTITDGAEFSKIPGGTYIDAITGDKKEVEKDGCLKIDAPGKGNMRCYVLSGAEGYEGIIGKIGNDGTYLFKEKNKENEENKEISHTE